MPRGEFQSLFSWMSLLNRRGVSGAGDRVDDVSILVLVDVALEHDRSPLAKPRRGGFNPCSRGCRS